MRAYLVPLVALVAASFSTSCSQTSQADPNALSRVQVTFSGGHDTDERDKGRPVVLISAALGVPTEVFRDAFSRVHPADPGRGLSPADDERPHLLSPELIVRGSTSAAPSMRR